MRDEEKIVFEMIHGLLEMPTDTFNRTKLIILANASDFENVKSFMKTVFKEVENRRPLLLTMKGGIV